MRKKILSYLLAFCQKQKSFTKREQYGVECLLIFVEKTIIIFTLAYFFNLFIPLCKLLLFFVPLRALSFGQHFTNPHACTIFSASIFLTTSFIAQNFFISNFLPFFVIASYYIITAPLEANRRKIKKAPYQPVLCLLLIFYFFLIKYQYSLANFIISATFLQALLLTNIFFKRKEVL